jgi:hypothetical protein
VIEKGERMERIKKITWALTAVIIGLSLVSGVLAYQLLYPSKTAEEPPTRTFVFDWPRGTQNVTDGGLTIHVNFTIVGDKLKVVAVINDSSPIERYNFFCLAFDANNNSRIDPRDAVPPYNGTMIQYPNNSTQIGTTADWWPVLPGGAPWPSDFHFCIFNGTHYIYTSTFQLKEFPNDIVQVVYEDSIHSYISVRFHFGLI